MTRAEREKRDRLILKISKVVSAIIVAVTVVGSAFVPYIAHRADEAEPVVVPSARPFSQSFQSMPQSVK